MACNAKITALEELRKLNITDDVNRIDPNMRDQFNLYNRDITRLAEIKYGVETNGNLMFTVHRQDTKMLGGHAYYRDNIKTSYFVQPNESLFDQLQMNIENKNILDVAFAEKFNERLDEPEVENVIPGTQLRLFDEDEEFALTSYVKGPSFNEQKEYYLAKSTKKLLEDIAKFSNDEDTKKLARALSLTQGVDQVKLEVTKYNKETGDKGYLVEGRHVLGIYEEYYNRIRIIGTLDKATFETVFLHEMLHAVTVREYVSNTEFRNKINELYNYTKDNFGDRHVTGGGVLNQQYGMTNEFEFIAEAMTNPSFIQELNKYYVPSQLKQRLEDKSIFQEFIDLILGMIKSKFKEKGRDFIEDALGQTLSLIHI